MESQLRLHSGMLRNTVEKYRLEWNTSGLGNYAIYKSRKKTTKAKTTNKMYNKVKEKKKKKSDDKNFK